ncbi:MAG: hypothetical protein ACXVHL_36980, partial [Solirubrobacteraceae bacterium]
ANTGRPSPFAARKMGLANRRHWMTTVKDAIWQGCTGTLLLCDVEQLHVAAAFLVTGHDHRDHPADGIAGPLHLGDRLAKVHDGARQLR